MADPTSHLTPQILWQDVIRVRESSPLVHSITNFVVMNLNANVLLSVGASPVMAHAHEEVMDMVGIAQSLVLNIGTLEPYWIDGMCLALQAASKKGIPTVLDPVGAGATPYRNASIARLMGIAAPTIIRGNGSEIMSTAGAAVTTRGVDSAAASDSALSAAQALVAQTGGVVCVSGEIDHILDAEHRWARLSNGHVWMTKITGVGCSASAMLGAFAVAQPDPWRATVSSMAYLGVAGQLAAERAIALGQGVGSMQAHLLDILQLMDEATFVQTLRMEQALW